METDSDGSMFPDRYAVGVNFAQSAGRDNGVGSSRSDDFPTSSASGRRPDPPRGRFLIALPPCRTTMKMNGKSGRDSGTTSRTTFGCETDPEAWVKLGGTMAGVLCLFP
jgi:hypothetical protein